MQKHLTQLLVVLAMLVSVILIGSAAAPLTDGQLIRGDVNGDGAVNMKDVLMLRKYLADMDVVIADHVCTADPNETQPSNPQSTYPSQTLPSQTLPIQTLPSQTLPSQTLPSQTLPSQTFPSQTQPSVTQPIYTMPSQTQPSVTQPSQTQPSQPQASQPANSIRVQMNIVEHQTKYESDVQTRNEYFFVEKGQPVVLTMTYDDVYHATNHVTDGSALTWFNLTANGGAITPTVVDEANTKIIATFDLGTAATDINVTGDIVRFSTSNKIEDFRSVLIAVNGVDGQGGTVRTTPMVTDPDYPAFPDMVTLAFNDPATCNQYGILWHTYKDMTAPVIQYLEGDVTDETLFAANATTITAINKSTGTAQVTLNYDPVDNWELGTGSLSNVTQYTFRGVMPTGLTVGQTYSYRVGDTATGTFSKIHSFVNKPSSGVTDNFSFLFLNDTQFSSGTNAGRVEMKNVLNAALSTCQADFGSLPQLVMHGGDLINTNVNTHEYGNLFGANSDFFGRYPMFASLGNHDAEKKYFFDNWNVTNANDKSYYSFNYGPMHVTVLDNSSNGLKNLTDSQMEFLQTDLAANAASHKWNFVMLHRPVYGAKTYEKNGDIWEYGSPSRRYRMTNICKQYNVDFVFQAHCHQYMRSYPITGYTKTDPMDELALKDWELLDDASYVQCNTSPTMSMENGTNYYVNPNGTIYGTFSTAGTDPDPVTATGENKWVAYAAKGEKYSFTAANINGNYFTLDHCYYSGSTVHYENSRGYGIKKAG